MAESGCLYNEKFSNIDVDNRLDTNDAEASEKQIFINTSESNEDTGTNDYDDFEEGQMIEIYKRSEVMSTSANTLSIEVTWPEETLVKTISLMFIEGTGTSIEIASTNNLGVQLGTKKGDTEVSDSIMSRKILAGQAGGYSVLLFKNIPITIVNNFTGIIGTGDLGDIPLHSPAFHKSGPGTLRSEPLNILDSDASGCWSRGGSGGGVTDGPHFPLYNPSGDDKRDKLVITLDQVGAAAGGTAENWTASQQFKVAAICTFVKMSSF